MKALLVGYSDPEVHASSRTRIYQFVPHLERAGVECAALSLFHKKAIGARWYRPGILPTLPFSGKQILKAARLARESDVMIVHQALLPLPLHTLLWRSVGAVIYSFTDVPTAKPFDRDRVWSDLERRFRRTICEAKCVLVENPDNVAWVQRFNPHVVTIVGPVDTDRYAPKARAPIEADGPVVIGWVGSPSTSPYLEAIEEPLSKLRSRFPRVTIELVGSAPGTLTRVGAENRTWALETERDALGRFDIGVMPLPENRWTRAKGGYKLLQYMALGIPSVASPVGINRELVQDGVNGYLARDANEWFDALARLVEDEAHRRTLGARARRIAEDRYSVRAATPILLDIMRGAVGGK